MHKCSASIRNVIRLNDCALRAFADTTNTNICTKSVVSLFRAFCDDKKKRMQSQARLRATLIRCIRIDVREPVGYRRGRMTEACAFFFGRYSLYESLTRKMAAEFAISARRNEITRHCFYVARRQVCECFSFFVGVVVLSKNTI